MARSRSLQIVETLKFVITIHDLQGDRAAQGHILPDAGEDFDAICFNALPTTTTIAALPPS